MLGWETEGKTSLLNNHLSFLNFEESSFLLTNNIPLIGDRIRFSLDLDIIENVGKSKKDQGEIRGKEVLMIGLSNHMLKVDSYQPHKTEVNFQGYYIYFIRNEKQIVFANARQKLNTLDLRDAYTEANSRKPNQSCELTYLRSSLQITLTVDFQRKLLIGKFDGVYCFTIKIDPKIFPKSKVSFTFMGYSTMEAPIQININEIIAEKVPKKDNNSYRLKSSDIRPNSEVFMVNFESYDPAFKSQRSLNNVLYLDVG